MKKSLASHKSDVMIICLLVVVSAIVQFILAEKHLRFGFFIDDWIFLSEYRSLLHPFREIFQAWDYLKSHSFAHAYYVGILYEFFGLNYQAYHVINQILKVVASVSIYPLIMIIFKKYDQRRWLAILAVLLYSIHYSPFGTLDNASRGEDFIAIGGMIWFLIYYTKICEKKVVSILPIILSCGLLFGTIFIDPTRMFPLLLIIPFVEIFYKSSLRNSLIRLAILYSPLLVLLVLSPMTIIPQLLYPTGLVQDIIHGNSQLFLVPFSALGSTLVPKLFWSYFGNPIYSRIDYYLLFLLRGPIPFWMIFNILVGLLVLNKSRIKFFIDNLYLNIGLGLGVFMLMANWPHHRSVVSPVDPGGYLTPAVMGVYWISLLITLFLHRKSINSEIHRQIMLIGMVIFPLFSLMVIILTWIFADRNSIFMGVHPYLNIPAIGTVVFISTLILFLIQKVYGSTFFRKALVVSILTIFIALLYQMSYVSVNEYFSYWLQNGLDGKDQNRVMNTFWKYVDFPKHPAPDNRPFFYLDATRDPINGMFYDLTIIYKIPSWLIVKAEDGTFSKREGCDLFTFNLDEIKSMIKEINGQQVLINERCGTKIIHKTDDLHAFRLNNRNITLINDIIYRELGITR